MIDNFIEIRGARLHNLKNITVRIPKHKIVAITGVSGSGKSSLAFDLLFEEGRSRYFQAIGMPPRLEREKPFDSITGLSPTIAVEQRTVRFTNPRSTVGTRTGIYNTLRMLYAVEARPSCPICQVKVDSNFNCPVCGFIVKRLEIKHFSFNEPSGMCLKCHGRGYIQQFHPSKIVPDPSWNLLQICNAASNCFADLRQWIPNLAKYYQFDIETPFQDLSPELQQIFLYGSGDQKIPMELHSKQYIHQAEKIYEGVVPHLERALETSISDYRHQKIESLFMDKVKCPECLGYRVNEQARQTRLAGKHIGEAAELPILELITWLQTTVLSSVSISYGRALIEKLLQELRNFELLGLNYLHLNRFTRSLSGGELQRLGLLTQLSIGLNNCILILDEPTIGMHEVEKVHLQQILRNLRDSGNSVIIVEHDPQIIQSADEIIDIGPFSGFQGGEIVVQGSYNQIVTHPTSLTGGYLSGRLVYPVKTRKERRLYNPMYKLCLQDISIHNLDHVSVEIPLGIMVGIAGKSGSGKSSLVIDSLVPLLRQKLRSQALAKRIKNPSSKISSKSHSAPENDDFLENSEGNLETGLEQVVQGQLVSMGEINQCVVMDQSSIGRSRNSFPASYVGVWDFIRKLFSKQPEAKRRGYTDSHFSFNSDKGRCPNCKGEGSVSLSISFLDEITLPCEECEGKRYLPEILEITYHDHTIRDVLDLTVGDAVKVFHDEPQILRYLTLLQEIGMDYLTLGQPATTLSGGEAQRVKLVKVLGDAKHNSTCFIFDEPSTGLHMHDEVKLLHLLEKLIFQGNSVLIIEHNPKILAYCDWIIELGPHGGPEGGQVIATGIPEELHTNPKSLIGPFLSRIKPSNIVS